jgi:predicted RNA binding protein YcfA (HicA-like mRNA interferase family)
LKYAVLNDREFACILKKNGYVIARHAGDHTIWYNEEHKDSITVNKNLNPMVMRRLIKSHNLTIN